ncbi:MAG: type II toxin-antitoxin system RelE/ParE family toxin [Pseudomonadota bacterium]
MDVRWSSKAASDLMRLYAFLEASNKPAAARTVQSLSAAAGGLPAHPRIGERLDEFLPREIRRILVGRYELRYEIQASTFFILRIWHTREER